MDARAPSAAAGWAWAPSTGESHRKPSNDTRITVGCRSANGSRCATAMAALSASARTVAERFRSRGRIACDSYASASTADSVRSLARHRHRCEVATEPVRRSSRDRRMRLHRHPRGTRTRLLPVRRGLLAAQIFLCAVAVTTAQTAPHRPLAIVAELDGIIHPVSAEYLTGVIDQSDAAGADIVVIVLRTPGGLLDSTRDIVTRMIQSRAPVVVFVGPAGGRAASAGFIITLAADVAVMAPGTHIGAAHPVSGNGQAMDDVTSQKAASDAAAYARTLAEARGRNVMLAAAAVQESRAFTDLEALQATPPLIDFTATDVDDVLRQLDGRMVKRFDGRTSVVHTQEHRDTPRRDDAPAALPQRDRTSGGRLPADDAGHDRPDGRTLESWRRPAGSRRRASACCSPFSRCRSCR